MNRVTYTGRITQEPLVKYSDNGNCYVQMNVASNRRMSKEKQEAAKANDKPTADFVNVKIFGYQAKYLADKIGIGTEVLITGKLRTDHHEGKYYTYILSDDAKIINGGSSDSNSSNSNSNNITTEDDDLFS